MQAISGTYKNGRIKLSKLPRFKKETEVTVYFHPHSSKKFKGLNGIESRKLVGLCSIGGNALEDTERLYE